MQPKVTRANQPRPAQVIAGYQALGLTISAEQQAAITGYAEHMDRALNFCQRAGFEITQPRFDKLCELAEHAESIAKLIFACNQLGFTVSESRLRHILSHKADNKYIYGTLSICREMGIKVNDGQLSLILEYGALAEYFFWIITLSKNMEFGLTSAQLTQLLVQAEHARIILEVLNICISEGFTLTSGQFARLLKQAEYAEGMAAILVYDPSGASDALKATLMQNLTQVPEYVAGIVSFLQACHKMHERASIAQMNYHYQHEDHMQMGQHAIGCLRLPPAPQPPPAPFKLQRDLLPQILRHAPYAGAITTAIQAYPRTTNKPYPTNAMLDALFALLDQSTNNTPVMRFQDFDAATQRSAIKLLRLMAATNAHQLTSPTFTGATRAAPRKWCAAAQRLTLSSRYLNGERHNPVLTWAARDAFFSAPAQHARDKQHGLVRQGTHFWLRALAGVTGAATSDRRKAQAVLAANPSVSQPPRVG